MTMLGKKSAAKVDGPPTVVSSGKRKAEEALHVKRQRTSAWKKKNETKWKKRVPQKEKKKEESEVQEQKSPHAKAMVPAEKNLNVVAAESDSESESDHSEGYVCELDTDGIDSSDDEHLKSKTMSIGSFSFNIETADILFKDGGEVVEVRFPTNEVGVFRGFGHVELPARLAKKKPNLNYVPSDPESDYSGPDVNYVRKVDTDGDESSDD